MTERGYRSVAVSGEECASLREMERLFRALARETGAARHSELADTLYNVARRYERAGELQSLRGEILGAAPLAAVIDLSEAAARRRRLTVVPGGSAA